MKKDIIVVGAGVAGLACARELQNAGFSCVVLEARNRLGGRLFTIRDPGLEFPIELGAEFVHGKAAASRKILEQLGEPTYDVFDSHFRPTAGKLQKQKSFWEHFAKEFSKLKSTGPVDRSFAEFLTAVKVPPEIKPLLRSYVEGFHAASCELISEKSLAMAEQGPDDKSAPDASRVINGYDKLLLGLSRAISPDALLLNSRVKKITWQKSKVHISGEGPNGIPLLFESKAAVVTLPLGVLKSQDPASAIEWQPVPDGLTKILSHLHMGSVVRMVFHFKSRFWEEVIAEPLGYLHSGPENYFPTWWTAMPLRVPILMAWQGGPKAAEISRMSQEERIRRAVQTLAKVLNLSPPKISKQIQNVFFHDWNTDPFSLGAYSYVGTGGMASAQKFAKPFSDTIFFAGEATHSGEDRGTINGAIETGLRAAKQVIKVLK